MPAKDAPEDFGQRLHHLREQLAATGADAFVETFLVNIQYLTGFSGSAGTLVLTPKASVLLTDARYTIQAREEAKSVRVQIVKGSVLDTAGTMLKRAGRLRMAYAPSRMSVAQRQKLSRSAGAGVRWVQREGIVEGMRSVKDGKEIAIMQRAIRIAEESFTKVLPLIRPGVRENDLAAEIEYRMRKGGASGPSFDTIVASGKRSALPHARPTEKCIKKNELVVLDLGAILRGYCSDLTRTVFVGRAPARTRGWYRAVQEAQQAARAAVRDGAKALAVDGAARAVLAKSGLGRYFTHSTGHGLGREVHEAPSLSRTSGDHLRAGQVVTLEPGVYVEGAGGIRIEDDVLVQANGSEMLTKLDRDLLEL
jgi:Xaa-Pro aminopeptidase